KMGLISDTGERKGATKRVRVFSLNITKKGNIKGNLEGCNEPENGNVPEHGNIPKNGMLNDPKNGIQNQSYNQSFNQERESRTKTGD
ncbi:primosomal protein, partial [Escherichia coli]|nr:primosomal protein [Escherichia coli]